MFEHNFLGPSFHLTTKHVRFARMGTAKGRQPKLIDNTAAHL